MDDFISTQFTLNFKDGKFIFKILKTQQDKKSYFYPLSQFLYKATCFLHTMHTYIEATYSTRYQSVSLENYMHSKKLHAHMKLHAYIEITSIHAMKVPIVPDINIFC